MDGVLVLVSLVLVAFLAWCCAVRINTLCMVFFLFLGCMHKVIMKMELGMNAKGKGESNDAFYPTCTLLAWNMFIRYLSYTQS